jgi:invasion protein IalB
MLYHLAIAVFLLGAGFSLPAYSQEATPAAPSASPAQPEPAKPQPAKPAPAKPAPSKPEAEKSAQPSVTSTAYGDWNLRCRQGNGSEATTHFCEISQTIEAKDQSGPIAKVSVGRPTPGGALHVVIILPNNVSFPSSVHIRSEENDKWGLELNWLRCIPGGCFADAELSNPTVVHWHGLDTIGSIIFRDAAGDEISLPMTFHGFGQAIDALNKS